MNSQGIGSQTIANSVLAGQGVNSNAGGIQGQLDDIKQCIMDIYDLVSQIAQGSDGIGFLD